MRNTPSTPSTRRQPLGATTAAEPARLPQGTYDATQRHIRERYNALVADGRIDGNGLFGFRRRARRAAR